MASKLKFEQSAFSGWIQIKIVAKEIQLNVGYTPCLTIAGRNGMWIVSVTLKARWKISFSRK